MILDVGKLREIIKDLPDDTPIFFHDSDGIDISVEHAEAYQGCSEKPAVRIQLDVELASLDNEYDERDDPGYDRNNPGL